MLNDTVKIAHIINPFNSKENPEWHIRQNITIDSILNAKKYSKNPVDLFYTSFADEDIEMPNEFIKANVLKTEPQANQYNENRQLPSLKRIFETLSELSDDTYIIYSNMDIGVMPYFYDFIHSQINSGHDAMIINRRRVSETFLQNKDINAIFSESGKPHLGYDCFIIKKKLLSEFKLYDLFIGIPYSGSELFYNIFCYARSPRLFTDKHLTFHLGFDLVKNWGSEKISHYNKSLFLKTAKELTPQINLEHFPGSGYPILKRHFKWIFNPTLHYPSLLLKDLKSGLKYRYKKKGKPENKKWYYEFLQKYIHLDEV